jgi:hypothetical protein
MRDPQAFSVKQEWIEEVSRVSNREYFTGYFTGRPDNTGIKYDFQAMSRRTTWLPRSSVFRKG